MILPLLDFFKKYSQSPMIWILIAINIFWFLGTHRQELQSLKLKEADLVWAASLDLPDQFKAPEGRDPMIHIYQLLMNPQFGEYLKKMTPQGDEIEFTYRQEKILAQFYLLKKSATQIWGFKPWNYQAWPTWISYQFMHGYLGHLLSNMMMLLIFGLMLEQLKGGSFLLGVYILSGLAGALGFLLDNWGQSTPMVGASAAISGIMGAYLVLEPRRHLQFFYFLSFDHHGFIYLSRWVIIAMFFLNDVAEWFASSQQMGSSVAYMAHMSGFMMGIGIAKLTPILTAIKLEVFGPSVTRV